MSKPFNVLISSAGRRVVLLECFQLALAKLGLAGVVHAADSSRVSAAFQYAKASHAIPRCTSPEFVATMLEICRREQIALVIPTIDTELPVYAAAKERFAEIGTTVAVSSAEAIAIANDKRRTHAWLTSHKLPTVKQFEARDVVQRFLPAPIRSSRSRPSEAHR